MQRDISIEDIARGLLTSRDDFLTEQALERARQRESLRPRRVPHPPLPPKKSKRDRDILNAFRNR